MTCSRS